MRPQRRERRALGRCGTTAGAHGGGGVARKIPHGHSVGVGEGGPPCHPRRRPTLSPSRPATPCRSRRPDSRPNPSRRRASMSTTTRTDTAPLTFESAMERFAAKFTESARLCELGEASIPGGGYSRNSLNFGGHPIYVDHGDGQFIYTVDGEKMLDLHNNFCCSVLGHNHPKVTAALEELVPRGFSFGNPMEHEQHLASILCERVEALEKVVFTCSASEACIAALRYARAFTGKDKIAKFEGGYHGVGEEFMLSLHPYEENRPGPPRPSARLPQL